jgi:hypothetical protein
MKNNIAGSRTVTDLGLVADAIEASGFDISEVASGGAPGVDSLAELRAEQNGIPVTRFPAEWSRYGRKAGPIRNKKMAGYAETLRAEWDGKSSGTKDMIRQARKHGLNCSTQLRLQISKCYLVVFGRSFCYV